MKRACSYLTACLLMAALPLVGGGLRKIIHFKAGTNSTRIHDGVIRGEQNHYFIAASAGQTMEIKLSSLENNAGFTLYGPGFRIKKDEYGEEVGGQRIFEGDEKHSSWSGVLKTSGKYLIEISSGRGNSSYDLVVSIR
jgi:hypothetical protein